jgi:2-succinyl-5-enolpyruvyl-6-hydroxy-3-cyclohexene-1-carboxylate synthase
MPSNEHAALCLKWSFHLVDALWRHGVREAFLSPGSRCTPLVLALVNHHGIRCHSVLDERSAAFMALGAGKTSSPQPAPALFVCTSGTAVANALPAVVEARMSGTPLIVLSADRPPAQRATGASQTIDQVKLFGDYPVFFFDTGEPVDDESDFRRIARLGWQAVHYAVSRGGPVHLNMPFRKPLEPDADTLSRYREKYRQDTPMNAYQATSQTATRQESRHENILAGSGQENLHASRATTLPEAPRPLPEPLRDLLATSTRTLVVIGPELRLPGSFFEFCRRNDIPVLNESGNSGADGVFLNRHALILHDVQKRADLAPDLVLRAGGDPVHRATLEALSGWNVPQVVFGDHPDHPDATLSATHHVDGSLADYDFTVVVREGNKKAPDSESAGTSGTQAAFAALWADALSQSVQSQDDRLQSETRLADAHAYASLLPLIAREPDTLVAVSNSFPIRDYLQFGPEEAVQKLPLLVNRGASGIDGVTSTAIGAALSRSKPVVLFTGDLAFLHDTGALNNLMFRDVPLKIIVLNNRGGTIFRMLPLDTEDPAFIDYFETPQQVDLEYIARAHGIPYALAETPSTLETAWKTLLAHRTAILECRTHTDASMKLRSSI